MTHLRELVSLSALLPRTNAQQSNPKRVANLYATLALSSAASAAEIKSSYRRLALIHHPDKLPPASSLAVIAEANTKFQTISFAYSILHDQVRRAHYDKTGRTEEGEGLAARSEQEWRDYFKTLWKGEVNADTIEEFTLNYQGRSSSFKLFIRRELMERFQAQRKKRKTYSRLTSNLLDLSTFCSPRLCARRSRTKIDSSP